MILKSIQHKKIFSKALSLKIKGLFSEALNFSDEIICCNLTKLINIFLSLKITISVKFCKAKNDVFGLKEDYDMPAKPNRVTCPVSIQSNTYNMKAITKVILILGH